VMSDVFTSRVIDLPVNVWKIICIYFSKPGRGVVLTIHPLLAPRSSMSSAIPLLPLWALCGLLQGNLYSFFEVWEQDAVWISYNCYNQIKSGHTQATFRQKSISVDHVEYLLGFEFSLFIFLPPPLHEVAAQCELLPLEEIHVYGNTMLL
jgi:hypothetical protein